MSLDQANKSIFFALGANITIALAKLGAALKTGSGSMMAEAIHSFSDSANQVLLLIGLKRSKRPPNDSFPLGHGKELYFYSFIVSILIFSIGGLFSLYEGFHKIHATKPLENPLIAIAVLSFSILAEGAAFLGCLKEVKSLKKNKPLTQWIKETRKVELLVILGEDFAAIIGLMFALGAISLTVITGNPIYDAIGSMVIGVLLIVVSFFLSRQIKDLLVGKGVSPDTRKAYINHIETCEGICRVLNIVSMNMGQDVLVSFKVEVEQNISVAQLIKAINEAEVSLKKTFPEIYWLFVEPDSKK